MPRWFSASLLLAACVRPAFALPATPDGPLAGRVCVRLQLGGRGGEPVDWNGKVAVQPGQILRVEVWDPEGKDTANVDGTFSLSTHRARPGPGNRRPRNELPVQPNGLLLTLADTTAASELIVTSQEPEQRFKLADIGPQRTGRLRGMIAVEQLAAAENVHTGPDHDDYPAAATAPDGTVYAAWLTFTPAERWRNRPALDTTPASFADYTLKPGADRLWLAARRNGVWGDPLPVTDGGLDLYRPCVAVDGAGVPWVFWSQHVDCDERFDGGDWELYARAMQTGNEQPAVRLTREAAADLFPSAATDAAGRITLAWMAFRGSNSRILFCEQTARGFGQPEPLADSPRDEWTPTVTAGPDGVVAVVWDTYQKGDYDVYTRVRRGGTWGDPLPVAGAATAEMNASAAFDPAGRLWVAYETSPAAWAKDWGALDKEACSLYGGRNVAVRVIDGTRVLEPKQAVSDAMPQAARRRENAAPLALPRLGVDGAGRVWVAIRHRDPQRRAPVGSVWSTYASAYAKDHWTPALQLDQSDAILDSRPTFLPTTGGGLLAIGMTDHRQFEAGRGGKPANEDLSAAYLKTTEAPAEPDLVPVPEPLVAPPAAGTEADDVARMRGYRPDLNGQGLRLLRGEFHRHTEISQDGGGDGTLLDMWRYALDAASLDWIGNGDHDNGGGREQYWWETQKTTSIFQNPPYFMPMYTYERSVGYPDGHRNVVFARRGVRTLARLRGGLGKALDTEPVNTARPHSGDTQMLYTYLDALDGVCASHTSATDMGTDWRDHDPVREPIVEIYQGDRQNYERPDAPRANKEGDSLGGWRPYGFVSWALLKGYRLGFQSSSDHVSTHISYCDVWVSDLSRQGILDGMKQRRVYGATDNILADYRCRAGGQDHLMGEAFDADGPPLLRVHFEGSRPMARVSIIRDNEVVYTTEPQQAKVDLEWRDNQPPAGRTSYYYVRGEQTDGELVWLSPLWIRFPG